jgi:coproporphyrinogen III oxidase-like Fe-S oxidoreductase
MSAYRNAHEAGFINTNIDLMYGLPGQTPESWESDMQTATELNPGWVSVYRLFFENPEIHETYIREPDLFPDDETVLLMNIMAIEKLTDLGYKQSQAPSTFLLPSKSDFDPLITLGSKTLGLGVSAWSCLNGVRYYNVHDLNKYTMCINKGSLPISFAGKYSKRQQIEREIVFMLRSQDGVNKRDFNTGFGIDMDTLFSEPLQKLRKSGMIEDDGGTYRLSKKGLLFCAEVFKEFYSQDFVDRFKNVIYSKKHLKNLFLNKKYTKSVEAISNIVKTMAGSTK